MSDTTQKEAWGTGYEACLTDNADALAALAGVTVRPGANVKALVEAVNSMVDWWHEANQSDPSVGIPPIYECPLCYGKQSDEDGIEEHDDWCPVPLCRDALAGFSIEEAQG